MRRKRGRRRRSRGQERDGGGGKEDREGEEEEEEEVEQGGREGEVLSDGGMEGCSSGVRRRGGVVRGGGEGTGRRLSLEFFNLPLELCPQEQQLF